VTLSFYAEVDRRSGRRLFAAFINPTLGSLLMAHVSSRSSDLISPTRSSTTLNTADVTPSQISAANVIESYSL
jgi:hypothetical protein|tara:strand:- start:845 stop:1063 length:219 start_codon:yes stop_codon:yes gene_type:complete